MRVRIINLFLFLSFYFLNLAKRLSWQTDRISFIIKVFEEYFGMPIRFILKESRQKEIIKRKHLFFYFIRENATTLTALEKRFGYDRTTIYYGYKRIMDLQLGYNRIAEPEYYEQFLDLQKIIYGNLSKKDNFRLETIV